jgi:outer membrane protein OmpA-like peptidoglycan-associated protein
MFYWKKNILLIGFSLLTACMQTAHLTQPVAQLQQNLSHAPVRLQQESSQLKITVLDEVAFQPKSSRLTVNMQKVLIQVGRTLHDYPDLKVTVAAYTDNHNQSRTNQLVSLRRAMMVADYLRGHGVKSDRIATRAMGEKNPIVSNATSQGRSQNHRIEILLS